MTAEGPEEQPPSPTPVVPPDLRLRGERPRVTRLSRRVLIGLGAVSATVQPLVSNDRVNWSNYGDPVTAAGTTKVTAGFGMSQNWEYYSALLTAISGVGAQASLVMNG